MPRENTIKKMPQILRDIADGKDVAEMPGSVYIEEELKNIADKIENNELEEIAKELYNAFNEADQDRDPTWGLDYYPHPALVRYKEFISG